METRSRYPDRGHAFLREMHQRHFWYRGRRRFALAALRCVLAKQKAFCAETPLGVYLPLPWGTSALAVVRSR